MSNVAMLKRNNMKSTIKIDYASSLDGGRPVIKIIQPSMAKDLKDYPDGDYDVRDRLLSDFLHPPLKVHPNTLFEVISHGSLEKSPDFYATMIAPLDNEQQFYRFRHNILNKLVPYNTLLKLNQNANGSTYTVGDTDKYHRITEFFDWLDKQEWATWEEQHPYINETQNTL